MIRETPYGEKVDLNILETLLARGELFRYPNKQYFLFSKSGFTRGCIDRTKACGNVELVAYEQMMRTDR